MLSLLASAALGERTQSAETYWSMWQEYQNSGIRWLPDILHAEEHNDRFEIFMDNVDRITEHNKKGLSWKFGVTPFADMTPQEFGDKVVGNFCKDTFAKRAALHSAKTKLFKGRRLDVQSNPSSINWDTAGKVTAVKNQGSCGSCWAFSTTGCIEARTAIAGQTSPVSLSEQELVDCDTSDSGCNGGSMAQGFMYAEEHNGLCLESDYSYTAEDGTCKSYSCTHHSPVSDWGAVNSGEEYLEAEVVNGPVSIAIEADQMSFQLYTEGVFSGSCGTSLDHGVLAVGYDNDATEPYWLVKNSWGASWGENGYIRMCKDCGKNGNAGQCGIASAGVYAVI